MKFCNLLFIKRSTSFLISIFARLFVVRFEVKLQKGEKVNSFSETDVPVYYKFASVLLEEELATRKI